jgi:transcriptional regulator with XRE-family HTH domain
MKTLAQRVLALRIRARLSQRAFDQLCCICASHTSMIECGARDNITGDTAIAISVATGCTTDWLLAGKGRPPTNAELEAAVAAAKVRAAARSRARRKRGVAATKVLASTPLAERKRG